MKLAQVAFALIGVGILASVWVGAELPQATHHDLPAVVPKVPAGADVITLGSGCFWRGGAIFQQIPGVLSVTAGYMGGTVPNPTYEMVCGGTSGHTEVSRIVFDPKQADLAKILTVFWAAHQPTSLNSRQARSVIFYHSDSQKALAEKSMAEAAKHFVQPIVTEIAVAGDFYAAEEYHQDYYGVKRHGAASCGIALSPELKALGIGK